MKSDEDKLYIKPLCLEEINDFLVYIIHLKLIMYKLLKYRIASRTTYNKNRVNIKMVILDEIYDSVVDIFFYLIVQ